MPLSKPILHGYVRETGGTELTDEAIGRLTTAAATAAAALDGVASGSLFDTEPEQLHTLLDELADGKGG